jgi:hypothetical protein
MLDIAWSGFLIICSLLGIGALWYGAAMLTEQNSAGAKYLIAGTALVLLRFLAQFWA